MCKNTQYLCYEVIECAKIRNIFVMNFFPTYEDSRNISTWGQTSFFNHNLRQNSHIVGEKRISLAYVKT